VRFLFLEIELRKLWGANDLRIKAELPVRRGARFIEIYWGDIIAIGYYALAFHIISYHLLLYHRFDNLSIPLMRFFLMENGGIML
jgi:hypothetical protein